LLWQRRARTWHIDTREPETVLLPYLAERRRLSIDVGAAAGCYTALLVPLSRRVVAFEPVPQFAAALRTMFAGTLIVRIEQVALSDQSGARSMQVPRDCFWRSTIENNNRLAYSADLETIPVTTRSLDDYAFHNVGLIKIDVEGHELAVLHGAADTIHRERPNVLVEVVEQLCSGTLAGTFGFFAAAGYRGYFLFDGKLEPLARFDRAVHQNVSNLDTRGGRTERYVSNFVFVAAEHPVCTRLERLRGRAADVSARPAAGSS
jgi:FkbM family methyltransferase